MIVFIPYNFEAYQKNFSLSVDFSVGVEECFTKIVKFYLEGRPTVRISGGYSQEMMGLVLEGDYLYSIHQLYNDFSVFVIPCDVPIITILPFSDRLFSFISEYSLSISFPILEFPYLLVS